MHIHELNPWRTLIALSVFVIVIIVGFLTMSKPLLTYHLNMVESIKEVDDTDLYFYPWELESVINKETNSIILFDIRDNFIYGQGHIPGAENMSANELSKEDNIKRLEELKENGFTVVLYGEDELQANGPLMLFRQAGFDNIKILPGGYNYYLEHKTDLKSTENDDSFIKGIPRYDFAEMAAPKDSGTKAVADKKPVQVQRRQKASVAAGGC
jgi:rhodanese-related sulfurtransferase